MLDTGLRSGTIIRGGSLNGYFHYPKQIIVGLGSMRRMLKIFIGIILTIIGLGCIGLAFVSFALTSLSGSSSPWVLFIILLLFGLFLIYISITLFRGHR